MSVYIPPDYAGSNVISELLKSFTGPSSPNLSDMFSKHRTCFATVLLWAAEEREASRCLVGLIAVPRQVIAFYLGQLVASVPLITRHWLRILPRLPPGCGRELSRLVSSSLPAT